MGHWRRWRKTGDVQADVPLRDHSTSAEDRGVTCPHRRCVNPAHLEAVTAKVNIVRSHRDHYWARTTHCVNGHEFTAGNTRVASSGRLICRQCITGIYHVRRQAFWEQGLNALGQPRRSSVLKTVVRLALAEAEKGGGDGG